MSPRLPRISRRKLLQIGSVAPLGALLITGTATHEAIAAECKALPDDIENKLWEKGKKRKANEKNFRTASRCLVEYFVVGAADQELDVPPERMEYLFVDVAYEQPTGDTTSGNLIADRSPKWEARMHQSLVCAYLCGAQFARELPDIQNDESVKAAYAKAFKAVQDDQCKIFLRARKGGDDDLHTFGAGC